MGQGAGKPGQLVQGQIRDAAAYAQQCKADCGKSSIDHRPEHLKEGTTALQTMHACKAAQRLSGRMGTCCQASFSSSPSRPSPAQGPHWHANHQVMGLLSVGEALEASV